MSICDGCIHDDVCGLEDNHEEGIVSCADRIPKDVLDKIKAEISEYKDDKIIHAERNDMIDIVLGIIDKYREGEMDHGHPKGYRHRQMV